MTEKPVSQTSHTACPVPPQTFCGLEDDYGNIKKAKVVVIPVPYEKTTCYIKGTKNGPAAIIDASRYLERFDDELNQETYRIGIHTALASAVLESTPEEMLQKVYGDTLEFLKLGKFPVILGGEHSISPAPVKALKEIYPDLSILHLDAHYDMRDEYQGSRNSHACAARRMSEYAPVVQVATRSLSKEEKEYLNSPQAAGRVKTFNVYDILETPLWKDAVSRALTEHVYISIDLDVFDPALMPAVGTPEPGGIGWYETLDLLKEVAKDKKVVGFDVVELCPLPGQIASDFLAAKLIYRLIGYVFNMKK